MNVIPAVYEQGVFRPTVPVHLPEGTQVSIPTPELVPVQPVNGAARQQFLDLIGSFDPGRPMGTNNEDIDRDLVREYGNDR